MELIVAGFIHVVLLPGEEFIGVNVLMAIIFDFLPIVMEAPLGFQQAAHLFAHMNKFIYIFLLKISDTKSAHWPPLRHFPRIQVH